MTEEGKGFSPEQAPSLWGNQSSLWEIPNASPLSIFSEIPPPVRKLYNDMNAQVLHPFPFYSPTNKQT